MKRPSPPCAAAPSRRGRTAPAAALMAALALAAASCSPLPPRPLPPAPGQTPTAGPPPPQRPAPGTVPPSRPAAPAPGFIAPQVMSAPGLGEVLREPAASLVRRFGEPRLTVTEGDMVKLQFAGQPCVLDAFLYPLSEGATPVATWFEARRASDGAAVDLRACIEALSRRR